MNDKIEFGIGFFVGVLVMIVFYPIIFIWVLGG